MLRHANPPYAVPTKHANNPIKIGNDELFDFENANDFIDGNIHDDVDDDDDGGTNVFNIDVDDDDVVLIDVGAVQMKAPFLNSKFVNFINGLILFDLVAVIVGLNIFSRHRRRLHKPKSLSSRNISMTFGIN